MEDATRPQQRAIWAGEGVGTGKPAAIVTKVAEGRLKNWLKEI